MPKGWRKTLVWSVSLFITYTLLGFLVLPLCIWLFGPKQITRQLDRPAAIRSVRINPFTFSLNIRGLAIQDKDGERFASWEEFYANFQLSSFFGKPWVFKEIRLRDPFVRAQMNKDYSFNFSDLLKKFSSNSTAPKAKSKPLFLEVEKLSILAARASLTDMTPRVPFHRLVGPIELTVTRFRTDPLSENPYSFSGTTDSGERFAWNGSFSLDPVRSFGELSLEGVSIPKYAALYQDLSRFDIASGTVSLQSAYSIALTPTHALASVTNASFLLKGLKLVERSNANDLVRLDTFRVTGVSANLASRHAQVGEVLIDGGRINVIRDQSERINLIEAAQPAEGLTNAPGGVLVLLQAATNAFAAFLSSTNLWSATLHQLDITNCEAHIQDLANRRPVKLDLEQISVSGRELSNLPGAKQDVSLALLCNTNGSVRIDSNIQMEPPTATVNLAVHDLELSPLDPYLESFVDVFILNSKLTVDGRLELKSRENNLPEVTFQGDARMDDFNTVDGLMSEDLVKWQSLQLSGMTAGLQPPSVGIKNMSIIEPIARVAIQTNRAINVLSALRLTETNEVATLPAPADAPPAKANSGGMRQKFGGFLSKLLAGNTNLAAGGTRPKITVDTLSISNAGMKFFDRSTVPQVAFGIKELEGTINGLSSDELGQADLNLKGMFDRGGQFEVTGKINPLTKDSPTDLKVALQGLDLLPSSPYAARFLGHRIDNGKLGLQVAYTVSQKQLKARNVVTIDRLTLGQKVDSPDATHLPVKLAVALLKDRNGKIELDVPIDGNLDDPNFHYGKVVTHVLVNTITKLVTSPFSVLGAVFGGKGEEVSFQDFDPGSAELKASQADKLEALLNGLSERPGLQLEIEGSSDPAVDAQGLRREKLRKDFQAKKWAALKKSEQAQTSATQVTLSEEEFAAFVKETYRAMAQTNTALADTSGTGSATESKTTDKPIRGSKATASRDLAETKGATSLLSRPTTRAEVPTTDIERAVLETVSVTEQDLNQLASERALRTQQRIVDSGKLEASRITVKAPDPASSSPRASRVYFHLQ